jgi:hypothetical protein
MTKCDATSFHSWPGNQAFLLIDVGNYGRHLDIASSVLELLLFMVSIIAARLHYNASGGLFTAPARFHAWHATFSALFFTYRTIIKYDRGHHHLKHWCMCDHLV